MKKPSEISEKCIPNIYDIPINVANRNLYYNKRMKIRKNKIDKERKKW